MLARIRNLNFIVALKVIKKKHVLMHVHCFLEEIKIQSFMDMILEVSSHNLFREIK
jgi:hypothetical protein